MKSTDIKRSSCAQAQSHDGVQLKRHAISSLQQNCRPTTFEGRVLNITDRYYYPALAVGQHRQSQNEDEVNNYQTVHFKQLRCPDMIQREQITRRHLGDM
jgi:hypothetical protein